MSVLSKPKPSIHQERRGDDWYVIVLNDIAAPHKETAFKTEAEANAFYLREYGRLQSRMS